jgi:hypothetical protein
MPGPRRRETVLGRIEALRHHARRIEGAVPLRGSKVEARQVLDALGEAEAWLRGRPAPELVTHVAKMVADAGHRLIVLGREVP